MIVKELIKALQELPEEMMYKRILYEGNENFDVEITSILSYTFSSIPDWDFEEETVIFIK